jgi:hypothetical protein
MGEGGPKRRSSRARRRRESGWAGAETALSFPPPTSGRSPPTFPALALLVHPHCAVSAFAGKGGSAGGGGGHTRSALLPLLWDGRGAPSSPSVDIGHGKCGDGVNGVALASNLTCS